MSLDKRFIANIIRNSYITALVVGVILYLLKAHLPERFAEGFICGAVCGITNLFFMGIIIRGAINVRGKTNGIAAFAGIFGLLGVVSAYCYVFANRWFNDIAMLIGFIYVFGVIVAGAVFKNHEKGSAE